jgi:hypothetical protein
MSKPQSNGGHFLELPKSEPEVDKRSRLRPNLTLEFPAHQVEMYHKMALKEESDSKLLNEDVKLELRCQNRTAATSMDLLGSGKAVNRPDDALQNHSSMMDHLFLNLSVMSCQGEEVGSEKGSRFGVSVN